MLDWICSSFFCRSETLVAEAASGTALAVTIRQRAAVSRQTARRSRSPSRDRFACFALFTVRPPLLYTFKCLRIENRLPRPPTSAPPATLLVRTVVHTASRGTREVPTRTSQTPLRVLAALTR